MEEELKQSEKALRILNSKVELKEEFNLPIEESIRTIIKIKKINKTEKKYPRKNSEIKKKPL